MTDTSSVALEAGFGAASASSRTDEPHSTPEQRRRNREDWPRRLRRLGASTYLGEVHGLQEAPATLAKKACAGGGPEFEYFGRIPYYRTESLDCYAESRLSGPRRSTSDLGEVTSIEPLRGTSAHLRPAAPAPRPACKPPGDPCPKETPRPRGRPRHGGALG
jgi:hypothetical protein